MRMDPSSIQHLTSLRACEKLGMFLKCYNETTGRLDAAKLKGFRTKIELKALSDLQKWDLEACVQRPSGKMITCHDLKRMMGPHGLGIGTREDGKPLLKHGLLARLRPHWEEATGQDKSAHATMPGADNQEQRPAMTATMPPVFRVVSEEKDGVPKEKTEQQKSALSNNNGWKHKNRCPPEISEYEKTDRSVVCRNRCFQSFPLASLKLDKPDGRHRTLMEIAGKSKLQIISI